MSSAAYVQLVPELELGEIMFVLNEICLVLTFGL